MLPLFVAMVIMFFWRSEVSAQVINEFYAKSPEWVEIYNNTNQEIGLSGWKIIDKSGNKNNKDIMSGVIGINAFLTFDTTDLNDSGDTFSLVNSSGETINTVNYVENMVKIDKSIGRAPDGSENWVVFDVGNTTKGFTNHILSITSSTEVPTPTLVDKKITLTNIPNNKKLGEEFDVTINLQNFSGGSYYVKVYGGANSENHAIEVKNNGNWNNGYGGEWNEMPKIDIGSTYENITITLRSKSNEEAGYYRLIGKIKKTDETGTMISDNYSILINNSPTDAPTATITPTTKFVSPTPLPTDEEEETEEGSESGEVMGIEITSVETATATPVMTKNKSKNKFNLLPVLLMGCGGIMLLVPLIIAKK